MRRIFLNDVTDLASCQAVMSRLVDLEAEIQSAESVRNEAVAAETLRAAEAADRRLVPARKEIAEIRARFDKPLEVYTKAALVGGDAKTLNLGELGKLRFVMKPGAIVKLDEAKAVAWARGRYPAAVKIAIGSVPTLFGWASTHSDIRANVLATKFGEFLAMVRKSAPAGVRAEIVESVLVTKLPKGIALPKTCFEVKPPHEVFEVIVGMEKKKNAA